MSSEWRERTAHHKSLLGPKCPSGLVPQMSVFRSESEVGVHSLSKALTTMRLVSVGSINPNSLPAAASSWPTVSRGKHHGGRLKGVGCSDLT